MVMDVEHRSKFAALNRKWWRLHMSEEFSSGTKTPKQANQEKSHGDRTLCQIGYANAKASRSYGSDTKTCHKSINLTLRSKVDAVSGSWMYATHALGVIDPCAKYVMPTSKQAASRTVRSIVGPSYLCSWTQPCCQRGKWYRGFNPRL